MTEKPRRTVRTVLEITGGLFLGVLFLLGVAVYLLVSGPVSIAVLTPTLESALNPDGSPYEVRVEDTHIVWGGWERALDVIASHVSVRERDRNHPPIASLPEVSVGLSFAALIRGDIRITALKILRPMLTMLRNPDGGLSIAFDGLAEETDGEEPGLDQAWVPMPRADEPGRLPKPVLDALLAAMDEAGPLESLQRFSIFQAKVRIIDRALGETLWLRSAALDLTRSPTGLHGRLVGTLETPTETAPVSAKLHIIPEQSRIDLVTGFQSLDTDLPVRYFPELIFYLPDLTISGNVGATFDFGGNPVQIFASLESAAGAIDIVAEVGESLPEAKLFATYDAFDAAEWLSGLYEAKETLNYLPRVPITGTAKAAIDRDGLPLQITAELVSDIGAATVSAGPDPETGQFSARIEFQGLQPAGIAQTAPALVDLESADIVLDGVASVELDAGWAPVSGRVDMAVSSGNISIPELIELPPLIGGRLAARMESSGGSIVVEDLQIDFGEPTLSLGGSVTIGETGTEVEFTALAVDLPVDRIREFWPATVSANARDWVTENISGGRVPQADLAARIFLPDLDPNQLDLISLGGGIKIEETTVHYLRPFDPAVGVNGFAEFGLDYFNIDVTSGAVNNAALNSADVRISELGADVEWIDIGLSVSSPLPTALALLDTEPRRYISRLGLEAGQIDGRANAVVTFRFPLLASLKGEDIEYATEANLFGISLPRPDLKGVITADAATLSLTPGSLEIQGDVALDDTPMQAVWRENFDGETEPARSFDIQTTTDLSELRRFDMDLSGRAEGMAGVSVRYAEFRSGNQSLTLTADLRDAELIAEEIDWRKPPGVDSVLSLQAMVSEVGQVQIGHFLLDGKTDHRFEGALSAAPGFSDLLDLRIDSLQLPGTDINGTIRKVQDAYLISLHGPSFNAEPFISDDNEDAPLSDGPEPTEPKLRITGDFDRIMDGPVRLVSDARLNLDFDGTQVRLMTLDGTVGIEKTLSVRYVPTEGNGRELLITAEDTGLALTVADVTGRIEGGALRIEGSRTSPDEPLFGRFEMRDFTLREAPRLVKILEGLSVAGLLSAINQEGLPFQTLTSDFEFTEDYVDIKDGTARGTSLGITVAGRVDRNADELDLVGELVVSDVFSKTLGAIPILDLIVGEGLIGVTYSMSGPIEDPRVSVNPLSAIAPGFLRKVFGSGSGEGADETADPVESERGN